MFPRQTPRRIADYRKRLDVLYEDLLDSHIITVNLYEATPAPHAEITCLSRPAHTVSFSNLGGRPNTNSCFLDRESRGPDEEVPNRWNC
jgi:hypothetical protein